MYFFFFKQKTAYEMRISDWSSDVCSSDLIIGNYRMGGNVPHPKKAGRSDLVVQLADTVLHVARKLRAYSLKNPGVVPLSPLESLVLLHVHRRPGVSPSDLAQEIGRASCRERVCQ